MHLKNDLIRARIYNKMGAPVGIAQSLVVSYILKHTHVSITMETDHNHNANLSDPEHDHTITIGSGSSESGSINATQISSIKLNYWNGTSWVTKNTITNTGKTLDYNVDLSNGGTYPDAEGYWGIEILTNSSSPDLVKAIISLQHSLSNN